MNSGEFLKSSSHERELAHVLRIPPSGATRWNRKTSLAIFVLHALIFWPSWQWYIRRMSDGSDEPWGIVSLLCALAFLIKESRAETISPFRPQSSARAQVLALIAASLLSVVYILAVGSQASLPTALLALLALACSGSALLLQRGVHLGFLGLLVLSLPLIASLQFYAGYPVRVLTTACAARLLTVIGYPVTASGTLLQYFGESVAVDAPCAGLKILWSSLLLHFVLSAFRGRSLRATWFGYVATSAIVFIANVLRASILFFVEGGIVSAPTWAHSAIGIFVFLLSCLTILALHARLKEFDTRVAERSSSAVSRVLPDSPAVYPPWLSALFASGCAVALLSSVLYENSRELSQPVFSAQEESIDWPSRFQGRHLERLPLSDNEQRLVRTFPGAIARFTDGSREVLLRRVQVPTRQLHPAVDCLRGSGYTVAPLPLRVESDSGYWNCTLAIKDSKRYRVCEQIVGSDGSSYSDVSTWYWNAVFSAHAGPWTAYTVAEPA